MERGWMTASVLLMFAAGVCLWRGATDAAFVTATLGAVAWFLSYRTRLRNAAHEDDHTLPEDGEAGDAHEN